MEVGCRVRSCWHALGAGWCAHRMGAGWHTQGSGLAHLEGEETPCTLGGAKAPLCALLTALERRCHLILLRPQTTPHSPTADPCWQAGISL